MLLGWRLEAGGWRLGQSPTQAGVKLRPSIAAAARRVRSAALRGSLAVRVAVRGCWRQGAALGGEGERGGTAGAPA